MKAADTTPVDLITCPICGRHIRHSTKPVTLAHCDKTGKPCPFSGQAIGAVPE